jgi:hypothetical protein
MSNHVEIDVRLRSGSNTEQLSANNAVDGWDQVVGIAHRALLAHNTGSSVLREFSPPQSRAPVSERKASSYMHGWARRYSPTRYLNKGPLNWLKKSDQNDAAARAYNDACLHWALLIRDANPQVRPTQFPKPDDHYEPSIETVRLLRDLRVSSMDEIAKLDLEEHPNRATAVDLGATKQLLIDAIHNSISLYALIDQQASISHPVVATDDGFNRLFEEILCSNLPSLAPSKISIVLTRVRHELDQQTRRVNIVAGHAVLASESGQLNVKLRSDPTEVGTRSAINRSTMTYD